MAKVLIAEPSPSVRLLLEQIVAELGHVATTWLDDASALSCDVLLLEPAWPKALIFAERLRARRPDLPIVSVSVRTSPAPAEQLGAETHIVKPFRLRVLEQALLDAIDAAEAA
jgi:CheY-like chemotaxis protein